MIEVEVRYLVMDPIEYERSLLRFSVEGSAVELEQEDEYFNHPCRDFRGADEALRLRLSNGRLELAYKGPRLDADSATREEFEVEFSADSVEMSRETLRSMLRALGFSSAGYVRKSRRSFVVSFESRSVIVSIDRVHGLPVYTELEIKCEEPDRAAATEHVLRLARRLNLQSSECRSYLELLDVC